MRVVAGGIVNMRLPKREHIKPTDREDPLRFYYRPLTGPVYRQRLALACALLGGGPFERVLEAGYGSGILLPELAVRSRAVLGLDLHDKARQVHQMLELEGVRATLVQGSVLGMPWPAGCFDAVLCLSVLEHLRGSALRLALSELARVTQPGAPIVLGFPVRNALTSLFFRAAGFRPTELHPSSHRDILGAIPTHLHLEQTVSWPAGLPLDLSLYVVCLCRH